LAVPQGIDKFNRNSAAIGELLYSLKDQLAEIRIGDSEAEGGEQLSELSIGAI
jgi:hypothetical protein